MNSRVRIFLARHAPSLIPRSAPKFFGMTLEVEARLYQRDVAERLRHVTDQPAVARIILLTEQPNIVTQGEQPLEQLDCLLVPPAQLERVRQPETASQEGPLRTRQPVHRRRAARRHLVPAQEAVLHIPDDGVVLDPAGHVSSWLGGPCRYRTRHP